MTLPRTHGHQFFRTHPACSAFIQQNLFMWEFSWLISATESGNHVAEIDRLVMFAAGPNLYEI